MPQWYSLPSSSSYSRQQALFHTHLEALETLPHLLVQWVQPLSPLLPPTILFHRESISIVGPRCGSSPPLTWGYGRYQSQSSFLLLTSLVTLRYRVEMG